KSVPTDEIVKVISSKTGEIYNLKAAEPSRKAIQNLYAKKGLFADVLDYGPLQDSPNTLNVTVVELTVNSVKVIGNERTKDSVIQRLVKTRPGQPMNANTWRNDLRRLVGTQWFETVENVPQPVNDAGKIDLVAQVKETKTGTLQVGLQMDPRSTFAGFIKV